jgi:hypothetical protein
MDDSPTPSTTLEREKHALELEKHRLELQRFELDKVSKAADFLRAQNDSIDRLMSVVKYLNSVQDGETTTVDEGYNKTTYQRQAREWNPLEEQIANSAMITVRRMLQWIAAAHLDAAAPSDAPKCE